MAVSPFPLLRLMGPFPFPLPGRRSIPSNSSSSVQTHSSLPFQQSLLQQMGEPKQAKTKEKVCDGRCLAERRAHTRDMAKWGKQMLVLNGLENVLQRALGTGRWRKFSRAVRVSTSQPVDFSPEQLTTCNWCLGSREGALGHEFTPTLNEALLMNGTFHRQQSPASALPSSLLMPSEQRGLIGVQPSRYSPPSALSSASSSSSASFTPVPSANPTAKKLSAQSPTAPTAGGASPFEHPLARFLAAQQQNGAQQLVGNNDSWMAMAAAAMQFFGATNGAATAAAMPHQAAAAAFLPALISSGLCSWPFSGAPSFANPLAHLHQNGSSGPHSPNTPNIVDLHQQLMLAWQSQLFAFGLMSSLNGLFPQPANVQHRDQLPSEDEALAFLAAFGAKPAENDHGQQGDGPLDLTKAKQQKRSNAEKPAKKKSALNTPIKEANSPPANCKREIVPFPSDELPEDEEDSAADMSLLTGTDGGEEGSEPESPSPRLGAKRTYSQADLDAAVTDIREGRLGTRRASVVYKIPRSTLRNKIYKLEAAEDNGDGSCKRRRLNAFQVHKREQRLMAAQRVEGANSSTSSEPGNEGQHQQSGADEEMGKVEPKTEAAVPIGEPIPQQLPPSLVRQNSVPFPLLAASSAEQLLKEFSSLVQKQHQQQRHVELPTKRKGSKGDKGGDSGNNKRAEDTEDREKKSLGSTSRPKRGQYRKYDKDALDQAVAAVKSGEMSVHRAGSHFGVPHSTLEYKVKERNLLRTKSKKSLTGNGSPKSGSGEGGADKRRNNNYNNNNDDGMPRLRRENSDESANGEIEVQSALDALLDAVVTEEHNGE